MRSIVIPLCLVIASCVSSFSDIQEAAPEWYEARKQELRGEGYPKLSTVPTDTTYRNRERALVKTGAEREALRQAFFASPRSAPANLSPAEISAWGEALKSRVKSNIPPANFLTDQQITMLKARFERPRARR